MSVTNLIDQKDAQSCVKLLAEVFHNDYCAAEAVPQHKKHLAVPGHFAAWARQHMPALVRDRYSFKDDETWQLALQVVRGTSHTLNRIWYGITLSDRPTPQHEVESLGMVVVLRFADGTISPITVDMPLVGKRKTEPSDGEVATVLVRGFDHVVQTFVDGTLDEFHKVGANLNTDTPQSAAEVFVDIMRRGIAELDHDGQKRAVAVYAEIARCLAFPKTPETHPNG